jgi:DNA-binding CsgD family transcriptional regulator
MDAARRHRDDLVRVASAATDAAGLFIEASTRLRRLVPYDAAAWLTTDPSTGLPTAPSRVEGFAATPGLCSRHWHHEIAVDDVNRFRDLARAPRPASSLRAAAPDGRASARFRAFLQPFGFTDELRSVLRVGAAAWASVTLWRRDGGPEFSRSETDLVAGLSAPLGEALRRLAHPDVVPAGLVGQEPPGVLAFDPGGALVSVNEHAAAWLAELPPDEGVPNDLGVDLPLWLVMVGLQARHRLEAGGDGTARSRIRSRNGRWLVCHASCTRGADGQAAGSVVVIEPASPSQIAPIIVASYGLTEREQEVTRLIARGAGTGEIARTLHLSPHTVRGHVKAILGKVGVSSRGELVATLYADVYEPVHLAAGHV